MLRAISVVSLNRWHLCYLDNGDVKFKYVLIYINSIHTCFQSTCNCTEEILQFFDVFVSVDNFDNTTTDLYVKRTHAHKNLLASICNPNHTKRSIHFCQALRILRICSNMESTKFFLWSFWTAWLNEVIIKERRKNR